MNQLRIIGYAMRSHPADHHWWNPSATFFTSHRDEQSV